MVDLQQEREHLALAEQHIFAGEQRVADQMIRIGEMTRNGQDTLQARKVLLSFQETLETWQAHRQLILDAIARG